MSATAKCQTCGRIFVPCASCAKKGTAYQWRANCDSIECFQVFTAALDYRDGNLSKQEIKDRLSQFDLDKILIADNAVKKIIAEALKEEPPVSTRSRRRLALADSELQESETLEE